jgi:hypothetical protein
MVNLHNADEEFSLTAPDNGMPPTVESGDARNVRD